MCYPPAPIIRNREACGHVGGKAMASLSSMLGGCSCLDKEFLSTQLYDVFGLVGELHISRQLTTYIADKDRKGCLPSAATCKDDGHPLPQVTCRTIRTTFRDMRGQKFFESNGNIAFARITPHI